MTRYKTARALEMAVKAAARQSPMDTSTAITGFYFHRLLVRIFADGTSPFVLKGGHGLLARTTSARRTKDIDIATDSLDVDMAVEELRRLVARDMEDYLIYEVEGYAPIKMGDRYRDGYAVSIAVQFGGRRMQPISIDLVADRVEYGEPEYLTPADRLEVADLPVCDYPVYPVEMAIVDKLFGIVERHAGHPSSRVKDLVDLVIYATHEAVDGDRLLDRLESETALRGIAAPKCFMVPREWRGSYEKLFVRLATQASLSDEYLTMVDAERLAARLVDPALDHSCEGRRWEPYDLSWQACAD